MSGPTYMTEFSQVLLTLGWRSVMNNKSCPLLVAKGVMSTVGEKVVSVLATTKLLSRRDFLRFEREGRNSID